MWIFAQLRNFFTIDMLQAKSTEANKIREQNNEAQLKIKELEHNISKHRKDSQDAADKVHNNIHLK